MRQRSVASGRQFVSSPLWKALVLAALFLCASMPLAVLDLGRSGSEEDVGSEWSAPAASPDREPDEPVPETPHAPPLPYTEHERLTHVLDEYLDEQDSRLSIALHDLATGATYSYAPEELYASASLAKFNILVLLTLKADDERRELSQEERDLASQMIRYSDNDAADVLYSRIGFDSGFVEGNERLGLRDTEPGHGGVWGATRTTTADQIRLLRLVFTDAGPLPGHSRQYIRDLMGSVAPEQAWGVSAAAGEGDVVELKNGWTPRSADRDRWAITSAGHVAGPDHQYLIAVLSDQHRDYWSGIECVEYAVKEVVTALNDPSTAASAEPLPRERPR